MTNLDTDQYYSYEHDGFELNFRLDWFYHKEHIEKIIKYKLCEMFSELISDIGKVTKDNISILENPNKPKGMSVKRIRPSGNFM